MPNIIRRPSESASIAAEPFRWMRDLMRWDPFREMGVELSPGMIATAEFAPAFEVRETADAFVFKADLPGVKEQDLEVKLIGNRLTIGGKREQEKQEKQDTYYAYERAYGSFLRSFTLPEGTDLEHVGAELKEGVLTVAVPKKAAAQPRTVAVKSGEAPKS